MYVQECDQHGLLDILDSVRCVHFLFELTKAERPGNKNNGLILVNVKVYVQ